MTVHDPRYHAAMVEAGFPDYYCPPPEVTGGPWKPFAPPDTVGPEFDRAVAAARRLVEGTP